MKTALDLELRTQQKLTLTPELRVGLTVLQIGALELTDFLTEQALDNPLLEIDEPDILSSVERSKAVLWPGEAARPQTLEEYLLAQLSLIPHEPAIRAAAGFLCGNLDDSGYLRISLEEASVALGKPIGLMQQALLVVQSLDPAGVGAQSLKECLLIQLQRSGQGESVAAAIVSGYLHDLAKGRMRAICRALNLSPLEMEQAARLISSLDPKPGGFVSGGSPTAYLIPDVTVHKLKGPQDSNEFVVVLNDSLLPGLSLSKRYLAMLSESEAGSLARQFLEERLHRAVWLLRSIEQRRRTLYRVAGAIVEAQAGFFQGGPRMLRPLTQRHVAAVLGMHESTVSRAVANKYAATSHGVFPLSYFFTSGVGHKGSRQSSTSVKRIIKDIIAAEPAHDPLSDSAIAEEIGRRGIPLSRRLVAKYRSQADIPPRSMRRRHYAPDGTHYITR